MEAIFGGSQATRRFAMGSNEPLGTDIGQIDDNGGDVSDLTKTEVHSGKEVDVPQSSKGAEEKERCGKRRKLSQEEVDLMNGMVIAVQSIGEALKAP
jgi:hypothetical protein